FEGEIMTREARVRDYLDHRANDSVRWIFSADLVDGQGQRLHGQPAAPEFFPCRPCPRGRDRDSVAGLPNAGGWGRAPRPIALGSPNRSAAGCDSHFVGLLFLDASAERD